MAADGPSIPSDRRFYSLPQAENFGGKEQSPKSKELLTYISKNIIGDDKVFSGPFGLRKGELTRLLCFARACTPSCIKKVWGFV